jgi:hypothetical protein
MIYAAKGHDFTFLNPHPNPPPLGEGVYGKLGLCQFAVYVKAVSMSLTLNTVSTKWMKN